MFIPAVRHPADRFYIVNLEALKHYVSSCVNTWHFWFFHTSPKTTFPHTKYCSSEEDYCAFIIDQCGNRQNEEWFITNEEGRKSFSIWQNGFFRITGRSYYLGFEYGVTAPLMATKSYENRGRFIAEVAGSQLSGTIISFKVEKSKLAGLRQVSNS